MRKLHPTDDLLVQAIGTVRSPMKSLLSRAFARFYPLLTSRSSVDPGKSEEPD